MTDIIFRNTQNYAASGLANYIQSEFAFAPRIDGDDIILTDAQAQRLLSDNVLSLHPQIHLRESSYKRIAAQLYSQIPEDMKEYQPPPPSELKLAGDFGLISRHDEAVSLLAASPDSEIQRILADKVLPLMVDGFEAEHVTGISINASQQQKHLSMSKIALLASRFDRDAINDLLKERDVLSGVLPYGLHILFFTDALTRLSPFALTLPIHRMGCAWHFQGEGMWNFPNAPTEGAFNQFLMGISPLTSDTHMLGLHGLTGMSEENIWRYLKLTVEGVNRLMSYLNDFRSFLSEDGSVDLLKKVQAYSAIHLLFADIAAINFSTIGHNRVSYALSALDKLANLRVELGGVKGVEGQEMVNLISFSQKDELKRLIRSRFGLHYKDLPEIFENVVERCYQGIHEHLSSQLDDANDSETARLDRIRSQRNIRHGSFLRSNQFEKLFFQSDGTVPDTLGTLPLLLVLGLICDPVSFLTFKPQVSC